MLKKMEALGVSNEELYEIQRLAHIGAEHARLVKRARVIAPMLKNVELSAIENSAISRIQECNVWAGMGAALQNEQGVDGLKDEQPSGGPGTYAEDVRSVLISLALKKLDRHTGLGFQIMDLGKIAE